MGNTLAIVAAIIFGGIFIGLLAMMLPCRAPCEKPWADDEDKCAGCFYLGLRSRGRKETPR